MKSRKIFTVIICSVFLLGGCRNQEAGTGKEELLQNQAVSDDNTSVQTQEEISESGEENKVVIEMEDGDISCVLYDFRLFDTPREASVSQEDMEVTDARYYADKSKFLLVQADISNISYQGYNEDKSINLSCFIIGPKEQEEEAWWYGSMPVYLSENVEGEGNYYHFLVNEGETKSVILGFYVPVKDAGELRDKCRIVMYGNYEDGYIYEIPMIQQMR